LKLSGDSRGFQEFLLKLKLPKMLVAGFATVTIGSVILAGFIVKLV